MVATCQAGQMTGVTCIGSETPLPQLGTCHRSHSARATTKKVSRRSTPQWILAVLRVTRYITNMIKNKQNLTISLPRATIRKAKVVAVRRGSSISVLLAEQIELLVGEDEAYERAQRRALAMMNKGFHMGGVIRATRDEWHER